MNRNSNTLSLYNINRIAIPAILAGIIEPFISLSDTMVAGRLPYPELATGAIGLAGAIISALVWILAQSRTSISSYVSQAYGANKLNSVRSLFAQLFWFNFFISILLLGITFLSAEIIFYLQNAEGSLLEKTVEYFKIRVFGFPITLLTFTIFGAFRGIQNTSWAMICSITAGIINISLNFYLGVYLEMGIKGLAYASLIAQSIMFLMALGFMHHKTVFRLFIWRRLNPNFWSLLSMTFNFFIRGIFLNVCFWVANYYATSYGETPLSVHTLMVQIWLFLAFFLDGYSNAANAISGKLLGSKNIADIKVLSKKLIPIILLVSVILILLLSLDYNNLPYYFTHSESIIETFPKYFWWVVVMLPINGIAFLYDGIFKGMGNAILLRNVLFIDTLIIFLPAIYILNNYWHNLNAVWAAISIWMIFRSLPLVFYLRYKV